MTHLYDDDDLSPKNQSIDDQAWHDQASPQILSAISAAKRREPSQNEIDRLVQSANRFPAQRPLPQERPLGPSTLPRRVAWICGLAASIAFLLLATKMIPIPKHQPHTQMPSPDRLTSYSVVTQISLSETDVQQLVDELDKNDEQIQETSKSIEISSIYREIEQTLDEHYDWKYK